MSRPPGRPLDPEVDEAIVAAATKQFLEHGIQRMTVPGVAAAAGVAKTTVYRRYATPAQLALAAIGRLNADSSDPDTGSARTDLIAVLEAVRHADRPDGDGDGPGGGADAPRDPRSRPRADDHPRGGAVPARPAQGRRERRIAGRPRRRPRRRRAPRQLLHPLLRARPARGRNGRSRWSTRSTRASPRRDERTGTREPHPEGRAGLSSPGGSVPVGSRSADQCNEPR